MSLVDKINEAFALNFSNFYEEIRSNIPNAKFKIITDLLDGRCYKKLSYENTTAKLTDFSSRLRKLSENLEINIQDESDFTRNEKNTNCGYGGTLTISADGHVYPCGLTNLSSIGLCKEKTISQWANDLGEVYDKYSVDNLPVCMHCEFKYICGGTCRINNYSVNGDLVTPHCSSTYKRNLLNSIYKNDISFENEISV